MSVVKHCMKFDELKNGCSEDICVFCNFCRSTKRQLLERSVVVIVSGSDLRKRSWSQLYSLIKTVRDRPYACQWGANRIPIGIPHIPLAPHNRGRKVPISYFSRPVDVDENVNRTHFRTH